MLILIEPNIPGIAEQIGETYTAATRNRAGVASNAEGVLRQQPLFDLPEGVPHVARDGKLVPYSASKEDDMTLALTGEPVSVFVRTLLCSREVADAINAALFMRLTAKEGEEIPTEIPLPWRAALARRLARSFKPDEAISESSLKAKLDTVLALVREDTSWQMLVELEAAQAEIAALRAQTEEARRLRESEGGQGVGEVATRRTVKPRGSKVAAAGGGSPEGATGDSPEGGSGEKTAMTDGSAGAPPSEVVPPVTEHDAGGEHSPASETS